MNLQKRLAMFVCLGAASAAAVVGPVPAAAADKAVVINDQRLYRDARVESRTIGRITVGEEALITEREGELLQVTLSDRIGWTLANGLVILDSNPHAAGLLFDAAETTSRMDDAESWLSAARLFRKAAAAAKDGPYAKEALWRAAELTWRAESRAGNPTPTGAAASDLNALIRAYPRTPLAARAAFLLLRTGLCNDWDGAPGCPETEIGLISNYLKENADTPHEAEARHALVYRHAALVEIYLQQGQPHFNAEKAVEHKTQARAMGEELIRDHAGTLWAARAERLVWSLDHNVGVFSGVEIALRKH